ncbi:angiopoietin-2 isoform X5 [Myotis daubentonii]|uniref:angiopoietin-2 isoform X5 n=1 Tax=Myotis daubentonii TaxID=98922 RepID=UPI002873AF14|nr:angiopoietin-2 isoform X5 [Myotis daubentonii]
MWQLVFLTLSWDLVPAAAHSPHRSMDGLGRRQYQVQHGACSYTFLLPETDNCRPPAGSYVSNAVQRDAPLDYDDSVQRLQVLEGIMENNTQWLMKLESYIQDSMRRGVAALQQSAAHNHTAAMMEMGSSLLNQTAAQTRKLTDVEAQVLNQTTRLELQLLEHSLSTNKLEKQILDQTSEISKLQDRNSVLEKKVLDMEGKHTVQLQSMKEEKDQLQVLVSKQNSIIEELEKQLVTATVNNSVLQKQQHDLMETVHSLLTLVSTSGAARPAPAAKEEQVAFRDCAEAFKSGLTTSGVYTLTFPNSTEETKDPPEGPHGVGRQDQQHQPAGERLQHQGRGQGPVHLQVRADAHGRLVVRRVWPLQPERNVLPAAAEHQQVQRHQVVLLEGLGLLAQGHGHDDPACGLLRPAPAAPLHRSPGDTAASSLCPRGTRPGLSQSPRNSPRTPALLGNPSTARPSPRDLQASAQMSLSCK